MNPFLDPYDTPVGGQLASPGQPLQQLAVPPIQTLIYQTDRSATSLAMVSVESALKEEDVTPSQPTTTEADNVGIGLDINLLTTGAQQPTTTPSTVGSQQPVTTGQTMGRQIPTNMHEARGMLHLISPLRTGRKNEAFNIGELRQIARNLNIPTSGKKEELANRIRGAIIEFFNLQMQ
jgi:hypothetical protein